MFTRLVPTPCTAVSLPTLINNSPPTLPSSFPFSPRTTTIHALLVHSSSLPQALRQGYTRYTPNTGTTALRKAICKKLKGGWAGGWGWGGETR